MIEMTLELEQKQIDLLLPKGIAFYRLKYLIREAFAEKGMILPEGFTLSLRDKAIDVGEYDLVSSFGIASGDRFQIVT